MYKVKFFVYIMHTCGLPVGFTYWFDFHWYDSEILIGGSTYVDGHGLIHGWPGAYRRVSMSLLALEIKELEYHARR